MLPLALTLHLSIFLTSPQTPLLPTALLYSSFLVYKSSSGPRHSSAMASGFQPPSNVHYQTYSDPSNPYGDQQQQGYNPQQQPENDAYGGESQREKSTERKEGACIATSTSSPSPPLSFAPPSDAFSSWTTNLQVDLLPPLPPPLPITTPSSTPLLKSLEDTLLPRPTRTVVLSNREDKASFPREPALPPLQSPMEVTTEGAVGTTSLT